MRPELWIAASKDAQCVQWADFANILQKLEWLLPNEMSNPSTTLEMSAMVTLEHDLRFGRSILWGTVGLLVVRLLLAVPVAAQSSQQQLSAPVDPTQALAEYQKELETNPQSSLAHYHIAELLFSQRRYQASANACRDAPGDDGIPSWTKAWSLIQLGEIFDATSQRDRAVREYQLAVQTEDNTGRSRQGQRTVAKAV